MARLKDLYEMVLPHWKKKSEGAVWQTALEKRFPACFSSVLAFF